MMGFLRLCGAPLPTCSLEPSRVKAYCRVVECKVKGEKRADWEVKPASLSHKCGCARGIAAVPACLIANIKI